MLAQCLNHYYNDFFRISKWTMLYLHNCTDEDKIELDSDWRSKTKKRRNISRSASLWTSGTKRGRRACKWVMIHGETSRDWS